MVTIADVCQTSSGGTPARSNPAYYGDDIPWVKCGDLRDGVITKTEERITAEGLANSNAKILPKGTLLIALYAGATIGRLGILGMNACTNQAICALKTSEKIDTKYLFWYLMSIRDDLQSQAVGGVQLNINQSVLRQTKIWLPPLATQKEIVAHTESLFGRLGVVEMAITAQKQKIKQCLDSFLSIAVNHVADFALPHEWRWSTIGEVSQKIQYGWTTKANFNAGKLKLLRTTDITSGDINWESVPFCTTAPDNVENYLLKEGDILISRAGSVGENVLIKNPDYAAFASYLVRFVPNQEIILPEYMHYFLQSPGYWNKVQNEKSGVTLANLNAKKISAMAIPLPPLKKQKQIVAKADKLSYNLSDTTNRICVAENLIRKCRNSSLAVFMREEKRNGI